MASAEIQVEVVLGAAPRQVECRSVTLPAGSTVADALCATGWTDGLDAISPCGLQLGCWGRPCTADTVLRDRDRIELTRSLRVDPKEARRLRYRRDGMQRPARAVRR